MKFEFDIPWWTWPLRRYSQWKRDRDEKRVAKEFREAEILRQSKPVFWAQVEGLTRHVDREAPNNVFTTHIWYLYETPKGERSYKEVQTTGQKHPWEGKVIIPWVNHQLEFDRESLRKGEVRYIANNKV